jgi:hypothetical protein
MTLLPYHAVACRGSKTGTPNQKSKSAEQVPPHPCIRVQEKGCGIYSTLNRKKKVMSSDANLTQILPSTTDFESVATVKGAKIPRSADSKKLIFICTLFASCNPMV